MKLENELTNSFRSVAYISTGPDKRAYRFVPYNFVSSFACQPAHRIDPSDWDIMYLKMLCKYYGIDAENHIDRDNCLVQLDGLIYSKSNTPVVLEQLADSATTISQLR